MKKKNENGGKKIFKKCVNLFTRLECHIRLRAMQLWSLVSIARLHRVNSKVKLHCSNDKRVPNQQTSLIFLNGLKEQCRWNQKLWRSALGLPSSGLPAIIKYAALNNTLCPQSAYLARGGKKIGAVVFWQWRIMMEKNVANWRMSKQTGQRLGIWRNVDRVLADSFDKRGLLKWHSYVFVLT